MLAAAKGRWRRRRLCQSQWGGVVLRWGRFGQRRRTWLRLDRGGGWLRLERFHSRGLAGCVFRLYLGYEGIVQGLGFGQAIDLPLLWIG